MTRAAAGHGVRTLPAEARDGQRLYSFLQSLHGFGAVLRPHPRRTDAWQSG
ncbi:hypothetical protein [Actinomyces sp. MRS3W]|uniref:hypothetical protein n=1 Tax=Actinomyces sp. MRS3W TaxID=2800796 RepID=UPI0028FDB617|nr:hypothetical protein [Actinomyces sp. MRS3W]MDU0349406.1 hypothetical protein [Actinomyces sp. MRS3W]